MDMTRAIWRTSAHSTGGGNNCVQIADLTAGVGVRDSKNPDGPALVLPRAAWRSLVEQTKKGMFDL